MLVRQRKITYFIIAFIGIGVVATAAYAAVLECTKWCYDPVANADTKGYHPEFLKQDIVKQTCIESHEDLTKFNMPDLGFCDAKLGTLP